MGRKHVSNSATERGARRLPNGNDGVRRTAQPVAGDTAIKQARFLPDETVSMDRRYRKRMDAYWARVERRLPRDFSQLDAAQGFDYWHTHVDWRGRGSRTPGDRACVAALTYRLLRALEDFAATRPFAVHSWATLCEDTGNNAVYLHSADSASGQLAQVDWNIAPPPEAESIVDPATHRIGRLDYLGAVVHVIQRRG